jgi:hypothetical protein
MSMPCGRRTGPRPSTSPIRPAILFCAAQQASHTVIHGRSVVRDGEIVTMNMRPAIETHNRCAARLREG